MKDFVENLRDTSRDSVRQPLSTEDEMTDMHDGEQWTSLEVGLKRVVSW